MWKKTAQKRPPTLSEEFVSRYWDLKARVDGIEDRLEETLADLRRRAASVATSERRLEMKKTNGPGEAPALTQLDKVRRLQRGTP